MPNARERIEKVISENPVVLFMKGTPEFPQCGFSGQVIQILDYLGAPVVGVNVLEDADIRQGIKEYANWPTISPALRQGRIRGRVRHHARDVSVRRARGDAVRSGRPAEEPSRGLMRFGEATLEVVVAEITSPEN